MNDVEQVHDELRAGQHAAHRRGIDAAHVDRDDPDRVPPGRAGQRQPVRGVIGGAALHLAQQPLVPGQVKEAGVPPVRQQHVLPGVLIQPPLGTTAAVLVDAQVRDPGGRLLQQRIGPGGERVMRGRPGHAVAPGRLRRGDPPLGDLVSGLVPEPLRHPAPGRDLRNPFGERLTLAVRATAFPAPLAPPHPHLVLAPGHIPRAGQHQLMGPDRDHAAVRARGSGRVIGDRPYLQRAAGPGLRIDDLQALHAEQHRRRILEHDARGFLMISDPVVRPKIVGAAGSLIRVTRR